MDETAFSALADKILHDLMDALDDAVGDVVDVDMQGGILTLELEDGRQFVINKHLPNRQIWLSSPVSGAAHFDPDGASGAWIAKRDGTELKSRLQADIKAVTGVAVLLG